MTVCTWFRTWMSLLHNKVTHNYKCMMYVTWVTSCALESYGMITTLDEIEKVQFSLEGQFKIEALGIFYWRRGQQRYTLCTYTLYKEADIQGYKTNHSPRATHNHWTVWIWSWRATDYGANRTTQLGRCSLLQENVRQAETSAFWCAEQIAFSDNRTSISSATTSDSNLCLHQPTSDSILCLHQPTSDSILCLHQPTSDSILCLHQPTTAPFA